MLEQCEYTPRLQFDDGQYIVRIPAVHIHDLYSRSILFYL